MMIDVSDEDDMGTSGDGGFVVVGDDDPRGPRW